MNENLKTMKEKLKYKCLVLDHDDTVMDSTTHVHYPSFLIALRELRPGVTISLEDYFRVNFEPGFLPYCTGVLGLTDGELDRELEIWKDYVKDHVPKVFPGMAEIIRRQKALGGLVCVVSHSFDFNIRRSAPAGRDLRLGAAGRAAKAGSLGPGADHGAVRPLPFRAFDGG